MDGDEVAGVVTGVPSGPRGSKLSAGSSVVDCASFFTGGLLRPPGALAGAVSDVDGIVSSGFVVATGENQRVSHSAARASLCTFVCVRSLGWDVWLLSALVYDCKACVTDHPMVNHPSCRKDY